MRRIEANLRFPGRDALTLATCQHLSLTIDIKKTELPQTLTDCRGLITGSERQKPKIKSCGRHSKVNNKHLMENLNVSRDEVEGNIEIRGKQNSLFPKGPVIK